MSDAFELAFISEMRGMRQSGQRRTTIDSRVKDQLRPLRRTRIRQSFRLKATRYDQVRSLLDGLIGSSSRLKWTDPSRRVKLVLHLRVAVLGAAHEGRAANHLPSRVLRDNLLAPESVLRGNNHPVIKMTADRSDRLRHLRRLRRHNSQIAVRKLVRPGGRLERYTKLVPTRDRQSL